MSGTKSLRIGAILEILLGAASIFAVRMMLGSDTAFAGSSLAEGESILYSVFVLYGLCALQIVAGLLGLLLSGKKSLLTLVLGLGLFLVQLIRFLHVNGNIPLILGNVILLLIPYLYYRGAYRNFRGQ